MDRYWEAVEAAAEEGEGARIGWGSEGVWWRRGKSNMARSSRAVGKALVERLAVPSRRVALRYGERELRLPGDPHPKHPPSRHFSLLGQESLVSVP